MNPSIFFSMYSMNISLVIKVRNYLHFIYSVGERTFVMITLFLKKKKKVNKRKDLLRILFPTTSNDDQIDISIFISAVSNNKKKRKSVAIKSETFGSYKQINSRLFLKRIETHGRKKKQYVKNVFKLFFPFFLFSFQQSFLSFSSYK